MLCLNSVQVGDQGVTRVAHLDEIVEGLFEARLMPQAATSSARWLAQV